MGTRIPSVRGVTQPSNGPGRGTSSAPAPSIILPIAQNTLSLLLIYRANPGGLAEMGGCPSWRKGGALREQPDNRPRAGPGGPLRSLWNLLLYKEKGKRPWAAGKQWGSVSKQCPSCGGGPIRRAGRFHVAGGGHSGATERTTIFAACQANWTGRCNPLLNCYFQVERLKRGQTSPRRGVKRKKASRAGAALP